MIQHTYSSFEEIDKRLKILSLQKEINKESIKWNLHWSKNYFCPTNIVGGFGGFLQTIILTFITKKLFKTFSNKFSKHKTVTV
ncbi:MAG: hypothetical protein IMY67_07320 [Bacteroidetes bacterium]|nr:hypothetical protein [Bacteroidota bacterium]